ncbi:hypothetical protein QYE76_054702 [Lolium multiflorum]|uniref:Retrotransposon Copia-like N-terminal domain-containing protein n=1 Tax=Lolium multiflorum TaxID=4521 RepID=A0AAD8SZX1_LOLMU|nr:hypothetical protein QYE76_054702 [Lolium multiflorum]
MWWPPPGVAPPGALAGATTSSAAAGAGAEGNPPQIANGGLSSSTNAPPPPYGGHPPPSAYGAPSAPIYGAHYALQYGASAPHVGASSPSGWPAPPPTYGASPHQQYAAPPLPSYGAPAAPISPYGAYPSSAYDGAAPAFGASSALTAPAASLEMAPPVGFYMPPSPAHATDPAAPSSPFYFSHLLPVKLTPDNYLSWRAQVLPLLRSRYVDGSLPCPPPYHPAHHTWVAQDQAILSAIQSSLTPSVSSLVLFASTSREAWTALHTSFASQSQARSHAIRTELGETKLHDSSITDYFNKMAGLADTLASIGQPLRSEDFTTYVLNRLDEDYDNLIENISGRDDPLSRRELYSRLLGREQRVKVRHASPSFSSANAAARGKPQKQPPADKPAPGPPQQQRSGAPPVTGGNRPRACCPSCGAQQACQLCGVDNHIASRCHRRFKQDFLGIGNNGKGNDKQAAAAVTSQDHGYTPSYPIDSSWYMDTGATNHLTSEMSKLSTQEPYRGHDQVRTANGAGSGHEGRSA